MGFDQWAYATSRRFDSDVDFETEHLIKKDLAYWRKHPDLHGWMFDLYKKKGGKCDANDFDCVPVALSLNDLERLEKDIKERNLPHTEGFFFGESSEDEIQSDLEFIAKAKEQLVVGNSVFYDSWW